MRRTVGLAALAGFIAIVFVANWAVQRYGPVPVGFGLKAPAGVYFAGLAFGLRDVVQSTLGRTATAVAIVVGAALSAVVNDQLAMASAVAFLTSEFADFAVYTPLLRRGWVPAVVASNVVGFVVDSVLFLQLAFHSQAFLEGQLVGKAWMTALFVVLLSPVRRWLEEEPSYAEARPT